MRYQQLKNRHELLSEKGGAKLSRIYSHMGKTEFAIMSAFRGEYDFDGNMERMAQMLEDTRQMGLGVIHLTGYWVENKGTENEERVEERSFFIPNTKYEPEEFLEMMTNLGAKYDQEAIVFGDKANVAIIDCETKKQDLIGDVKTIKTNDLGDAYSNIRGQNFAFEDED
jgi:hypothetical protein